MFSVSIHSCPCFWYKKQGLFCARAIGCADTPCASAYALSAYGRLVASLLVTLIREWLLNLEHSWISITNHHFK